MNFERLLDTCSEKIFDFLWRRYEKDMEWLDGLADGAASLVAYLRPEKLHALSSQLQRRWFRRP